MSANSLLLSGLILYEPNENSPIVKSCTTKEEEEVSFNKTKEDFRGPLQIYLFWSIVHSYELPRIKKCDDKFSSSESADSSEYKTA